MQNAIVLDKSEVTKIESQVNKELALTENISIRSQKDLENAKQLLSNVVTLKKQIKDKKEGMTKPINEGLKAIRGFFAPIETKIENAETFVKRKMLDWNNKIRAEEAKKSAEVTAKVEAGEMTMAKAGAAIERVQAKQEAIPTRKVKKVVVESEANIPDEYWIVDMVKLRAAALGGVQIPGVKVVEEETIVGRSF